MRKRGNAPTSIVVATSSAVRVARCTAAVAIGGWCVLLWASCAGLPAASRERALAPLPTLAADSVRTDTIGPGLVHAYVWLARGPWAVHILDVDRSACWSAVAVKAGGQAVGRERPSEAVRALAARTREAVAGGVNADFFSFEPPGVPVGPHVTGERVVTGPGDRPVLAFDGLGTPFIGTFFARGVAFLGDQPVNVDVWNRRSARGLALFDPSWGPATDTASGAVEVTLGGSPPTVIGVDTASAGVTIPRNGVVLVVGRDALAGLRRSLLGLERVASARWAVALEPFHPREAVGGFPVLVADSVLAAGLDSAGGAGFGPARHPRTAVGIAAGGRRLLLVTVDGRQAPYSDGMTLRELAEFLRGLGAADAINLDGGGSTALVLRRPDGSYAPVNRPSDREGERAVANTLAVVRRCATGRESGR